MISAKHGLLDPDDVVGPVDVLFGDRPPGYRTAWGQWVVAQLAHRGAGLEIPLPGMWSDDDAAGAEQHPQHEEQEEHETAARTALHRLRGLVARHGAEEQHRRA